MRNEEGVGSILPSLCLSLTSLVLISFAFSLSCLVGGLTLVTYQQNTRYQDHKSRQQQQWIPGLFVQIQLFINQLKSFKNDLSRPPIPIWLNLKFFARLFLRRSFCFHFVHNPNSNSCLALTARQHFTRNVSNPVYHYWLNSWLVHSTSLTCTSNCTWLRSYRERNLPQQLRVLVCGVCLLHASRALLPPPRFTPWTPHITSTTIPPLCPTNSTISLTHTWLRGLLFVTTDIRCTQDGSLWAQGSTRVLACKDVRVYSNP